MVNPEVFLPPSYVIGKIREIRQSIEWHRRIQHWLRIVRFGVVAILPAGAIVLAIWFVITHK